MVSEDGRSYEASEVVEAVDHHTARTIPVQVSIDAKQTILSMPEMEVLLSRASQIALGPCECRDKQKNCDAPVEVCLSVGKWAMEEMLAHEGWRIVTLEEALDALRRSHEAGLVHLAYRQRDQEISQICSCCSCCCWFLIALKRFDYHDAIVESAYAATYDPTLCSACGVCVERCQFDAWTKGQATSGNGVSFDPARCFGCGVCVSSCPTGAISFVERDGVKSDKGRGRDT
jgi:NAD-dependent dihydropyrimidine dehydrogenase PreA subunit